MGLYVAVFTAAHYTQQSEETYHSFINEFVRVLDRGERSIPKLVPSGFSLSSLYNSNSNFPPNLEDPQKGPC